MITRAIAAALAVAALGAAASLPAQPAGKAAARDWTRAVSATPDGGFRVGNPAAPMKLVEYGSLTCDHCAHFARDGMPKLLAGPVKSGQLSFEFRNFVRDPYDMTAALLARCAGPGDFFALTDALFDAQRDWIARYQAMTPAQSAEMNALTQGQKIDKLAEFGGLYAIAARHGVPAAKAKACVTDEAAFKKLAEMRKIAAERDQLQGTPHFLLNGKPLAVHDWAGLEPLLKTPAG
ncbi:thioredoxin domain-containing protein [Allosphingosinicella indica]|uniref:Protein-disulfide isomerase n=1 Tax=Allosphingosinicella indica TaxID=941907 RepID=A0A1X7GFF1_9SPHN|nr:thioredoxin domain-containing protein [Allosphingosinicella indica]SMF68818.1 Protein-disulfide isomerase [Allosphingosinicella indica]